jgi:hypothetical protein
MMQYLPTWIRKEIILLSAVVMLETTLILQQLFGTQMPFFLKKFGFMGENNTTAEER